MRQAFEMMNLMNCMTFRIIKLLSYIPTITVLLYNRNTGKILIDSGVEGPTSSRSVTSPPVFGNRSLRWRMRSKSPLALILMVADSYNPRSITWYMSFEEAGDCKLTMSKMILNTVSVDVIRARAIRQIF